MRVFNNRPGITYDPDNVYVLYAEDLNEFVSELQSLQTNYNLMQADLIARIGAKQFKFLGSDVVTTSTTLSPVENFSVALYSGKSYKISFRGLFETTVTTTGPKFGCVLDSGSASALGEIFIQREQNPGTSFHRSAIRAVGTTVGTVGAFEKFLSTIDINLPLLCGFDIIVNCTENCYFSPTFASEVGSSQIKYLSGASLICEEITIA